MGKEQRERCHYTAVAAAAAAEEEEDDDEETYLDRLSRI